MTTDRPELADEELTTRLAEALRGKQWIRKMMGDGHWSILQADESDLAAVLLPVVRQYGDRWAAKELETMADTIDDWHLSACDPVLMLRARAATLHERADRDR
jgi:hypothetical protein